VQNYPFEVFFFESCYDSRKKEGWTGLWRGITPRLSGIALQSFAAAKFDELVPPGIIHTSNICICPHQWDEIRI
jgi:hypothetical protein